MEGTLSKRDLNWLNTAGKIAETSECRMRHGAIVVRGGSVLGAGVNKRKNNPANIEEHLITTSCGDHAEVSALKRTSNPKGATLYVVRVNNFGEFINSKPCANCQIALDKAGVRRVVWSV